MEAFATQAIIVNLILSSLILSCGGGSSGGGGGSGGSEVSGSLKSSTGNLAENSEWSVVFLERNTGNARVGTVGPAGKYTINNLRTGEPMTAFLLNPQFVLKSVITSPDTTIGQVKQFFTLGSNSIPSLIQTGSIVKFSDIGSVSFTSDVALDQDFDGVPDGMEENAGSASQIRFGLAELVDQDQDGIRNEDDPDIDGDGIANWIDADLDGDGTLNIFDIDANGNSVEDYLEENSELYFTQGLEYLTVQVVQEVIAGSLETSLVINCKVRGGEAHDEVNVRGPESLFDGAVVSSVNPTSGQTSTAAWDFTLADDGLSGDSEEDDLIYARTVTLGSGIYPIPDQVIFVRLQIGQTASRAQFKEFPFQFSRVNTAVVSGSSSGNTISISGTPFVMSRDTSQEIIAYTWSVILFDENESKVFGSDQIDPNESSSYTVPQGVVPTGTYSAVVIAQAQSRIEGFPSWTIRSAEFSVTITQ